MGHFGALIRALAGTAGRAAVQRALPLYLGLLLLASVLFGGSGVRPADVVAAARASHATLLGMYAAWTVVSLPALSALLGAPASFFLRSLPLARGRVLGLLAVGIGLAELPWFLLWLRGGGLGAGWTALACAIALATLLLTRPLRIGDFAAACLLVGTLLGSSLGSAPRLLSLATSTLLAVRGTFLVWLRAPEQAPFALRGWGVAVRRRSLKQAREEVWGQPLAAWRERLGLDGVWSQRLGSLSFGQRKRVCLLAALLGDPWLLLLDEPSNGLDPGGRLVRCQVREGS